MELAGGESESWSIGWEFDIAKGDLLLPAFKYPTTGTTLSMNNLDIASLELDLILSELIAVEYTP